MAFIELFQNPFLKHVQLVLERLVLLLCVWQKFITDKVSEGGFGLGYITDTGIDPVSHHSLEYPYLVYRLIQAPERVTAYIAPAIKQLSYAA